MIETDLKGRDFLRINDWTAEEIRSVLDLADELKQAQRAGMPHRHLDGRVIALVFNKPSTRTRVSFGAGIAHLGATPLPLGRGELHLGRGEPVSDTAKVLSRYVDGIVIRTYAQAEVDELAENANVPVINALTDEFHPCQALADVMTVREHFRGFEDVAVAYVGDGNNVCHSLMVASAKLGLEFIAATPAGYEPDDRVVGWAEQAANASGASVSLTRDPVEAARRASVLYTDVWTSMGQEGERDRRVRDLEQYRLDEQLLAHAPGHAIVMHCLPAHRDEEITDAVLNSERSVVWDQAENRLHTQKALLAMIIP